MFKGKLPDAVLASLLETLPVEFSIVDANDKVLAWNRHETRVFRRTDNVLGRDVRVCILARASPRWKRSLLK